MTARRTSPQTTRRGPQAARRSPSGASRLVPAAAPRTIPLLGRARLPALPAVAERETASGLRIFAVRRAGVPIVELRLRIPFAGMKPVHLARAALLGEAFFSGTPEHTAQQVAATLQTMGGALGAHTDADSLVISGSALAPQLPALLALLAELLTANAYPKSEVSGHRARIAEELVIARSEPGTIAHETALRRRFGARHPYSCDLPESEAVLRVARGELRELHDRRVRPAGSSLVLVGDIVAGRALDLAEGSLEPWVAAGDKPVVVPAPPNFHGGGITFVDRPGAVQTTMRLVGPAPDRKAPDYAAARLATMIFGGYFSSRLVANIRESKGYTYSPRASIDHADAASSLVVAADVASEVTAAALLETRYELGRIATVAVTEEELLAARHYIVGTMAQSTASQAALASTLLNLVTSDLPVTWLRDFPVALAAVTVDQVLQAAAGWLGPARLATVLVGDRTTVRAQLAPLDPID